VTPVASRSQRAVRWRAWVRSARFPSQLTILLPLVVGQLLAPGRDLGIFAAVLAFGLCDQLYIVWANDYADRFDDPYNEHATPFAGGSRVLVQGALSPGHLRNAAGGAALAALGIAVVTAWTADAPELVGLALLSLALLWAYSFPPFRFSHRGGGEVLQMLGVGAVLPWYGYLAQSGHPTEFPALLLVALLLLELGCALATTRPDEEADRRVDKRTLSVLLGGRQAGGLMVVLHFAGLATLGRWLEDPSAAFAVTALPALANGGALVTVGAKPGTGLMVLHAFSALMVTVGALSLLVWHLATL